MKDQETRGTTLTHAANHLARLLAVIAVGLMASVAFPRTANAIPALSPIEDREAYNLNDAEWDVLWEIQQQCYEILCGSKATARFTYDVSGILGGNTWSSENFDLSGWDGTTSEMLYCSDTLQNRANDSIVRIIDVLSAEKPYLMEWVDENGWNTTHVEFRSTACGNGSWSVTAIQGTCRISVAPFCSTGRPYEVSADSMRRMRDALDFAQEVAKRCRSTDTWTRIKEYSDSIQQLTSYDSPAVGHYAENSLSWSLLSVFDGDTSTLSVCTAYSKALKVLFDLSGEKGASCYVVQGDDEFGGARHGHMWNIVRIDGRSYLTDITNSQQGGMGYGSVFIVPARGTIESGYGMTVPNAGPFRLIYDERTIGMFKDSVLVISETPYANATTDRNTTEAVSTEEQEAPVVGATKTSHTSEGQESPAPSTLPEEQQDAETERHDWSFSPPHAETTYIAPDLAVGCEMPTPSGDEWVVPVAIVAGLIVIASMPVLFLSILRAGRCDRR